MRAFITAAAPWVVMGISFAILIVFLQKKHREVRKPSEAEQASRELPGGDPAAPSESIETDEKNETGEANDPEAAKDTGAADQPDNHMVTGMCIGMAVGAVLSLSGILSLTYGISMGMLWGMIIGMNIRK